MGITLVYVTVGPGKASTVNFFPFIWNVHNFVTYRILLCNTSRTCGWVPA